MDFQGHRYTPCVKQFALVMRRAPCICFNVISGAHRSTSKRSSEPEQMVLSRKHKYKQNRHILFMNWF